MSEETEEIKAKWAAEAYAFLSLFRRLRNRLPGLLMLQLGWGLLVRLVAPLAETPPGPGHHASTPTAMKVYLIGAVVLAAYWYFSSGCWKILYLCFARISRPFLSILLFVLLLIFIVGTSPLSALAALIEWGQFRYWLRQQDTTKIAKIRADVEEPKLKEEHEKESKSSADPPISFEEWKKSKGDKWIERERRRLSNPVLRDVFESKVKFRALRPWSFIGELVGRWRVRLDSIALIGLAPFHSYSFDEEQRSAKAPLQIFASAIRRLRLGLSDRMIANNVRFRTIPEILTIESEDAARRWRSLLGLDTLLWGSYTSSTPPLIWLNMENKALDAEPPDDEDDRQWRDWDPMGTKEIDFAMMRVNQDDQIDSYFVVLACLLRTLQRRPKPRRYLFWAAQDALTWKKYSGERIFLRVVRPILSILPEIPELRELDATPTQMIVTYISNWAAHEIAWFSGGDRDLWVVRDMLRHCVRVMPNEPQNHYRLGAVEAILGKEKEALSAFARAQELDGKAEFYNPENIAGYAGTFLNIAYEETDVSAGRAAAAITYVARAIKLGGPNTIPEIKAKFVDTRFWKWQEKFAEYGIEPRWSTTDLILCSMLKLDLPKAKAKDKEGN